MYSSIFVVLLQLRKVKSAIESILIRGALGSAVPLLSSDLKSFHALRSRFTWLLQYVDSFLRSYERTYRALQHIEPSLHDKCEHLVRKLLIHY